MLQFGPGELSRHLRVEGAYCQTQEIQMIQVFKMKIICSFKDYAAHDVSQSDRQDDDQQVKASCSSHPCQCHSGKDARRSECVHVYINQRQETRKESVTSYPAITSKSDVCSDHFVHSLDGQNRQSPIASVQRTRSTLASHSAVPCGTNVKRMNANRAIRIAAQRTQGL